ncbi:MAG TPA: energy transducer TonB [Vicinamibacterales bacterium]|nr:energy transducer TonB [Vicinamibacterales bacterium]
MSTAELYSPSEIARAADVPIGEVLAALRARGYDARTRFVPHADAVRIGRALVRPAGDVDDDGLMRRPAAAGTIAAANTPIFSVFSRGATPLRSPRAFALSSTLHAAIAGVIIAVATVNIAPEVVALRADDHPPTMQMVFLATPGPGGGGGGGGLRQPAPPPKAKLEGRRKISSPIVAKPPQPIAPPPRPVLEAKAPPPPIVAPIATMPADKESRVGVAEETKAETPSSGPGKGGGAGSGAGVGIGPGDGSGVGPGSGGGFGGGPYRPGSGITPPRLLREVKADYTEEARRRGLAGEVVLEIVVRSDGSIGDVRVLQGLGGGLNERAAEAVRQWRFEPAQRLGKPVDVFVEVAVEFKLR